MPVSVLRLISVPHSCLGGAGYQLCATFLKRCIVPDSFTPTERTRVVREPHRGVYDRETTYKILDEGMVCHVGFSADSQPFVFPTPYALAGAAIYFHVSRASRMLPVRRARGPG